MPRLHPHMEICRNCSRTYRVETNGWMIRHPIRFGSAFFCPEEYHGTIQSGARSKEVNETSFQQINFPRTEEVLPGEESAEG